MFKGILHLHITAVVLFMLLYIIKTILLLLNKTETLEKVKQKMRIPEMIISTLFLLTGIYLIMNIPNPTSVFMVVKLALVLASIPLAVIGFKKSNKILAVCSVLCIIIAYGMAEMSKKAATKPTVQLADANKNDGAVIYTSYCKSCHGDDGKLMLAGAKDLSISSIDVTEVYNQVKNGKGAMPAYESSLSEEQLNAVSAYVLTLRQ